MNPVINEHDVRVYLGDARDVLRELPDRSVQCVVTSPPYYGLRDYGVDGQLGLEPSPAEYVAEMVGVFREARRVLADDGVLWLNLGDSYSAAASGPRTNWGRLEGKAQAINSPAGFGDNLGFLPPKNLLGIPWRVAFALQDDGWTLRNAVIWNKPNAMPESVTDRLSTRYEHVFLFSKSRRYWFDVNPIREAYAPGTAGRYAAGYKSKPKTLSAQLGGGTSAQTMFNGDVFGENPLGRNPGDVWTIATSPFPGAHFATMPPELAKRCILAGSPEGATVLDPFTGSGTTAMVARKLGRRFVGAELNPAYVPIIEDRIGPTPFNFGEVSA